MTTTSEQVRDSASRDSRLTSSASGRVYTPACRLGDHLLRRRFERTRNHANSLAGTSESPLLYASKISGRSSSSSHQAGS